MKSPEANKRRSEMLAKPKIARRVEWCARSAFLTTGASGTGRNLGVFWTLFGKNLKNLGQIGVLMRAIDLLAKTASSTHFRALF